MFHWICPECGREIPPAVKECSTCDPQAAAATTREAAPAAATPAAPVATPSRPDPLLNLAQKLREAQRENHEAQREIPKTLEPVVAAAPAATAVAEPEPEPDVVTATPPDSPHFAPQISSMLLLAAAPSAVALLEPVAAPEPVEPLIEFPALFELAEVVAATPPAEPPVEAVPEPKPEPKPEPADPATADRVNTPAPTFTAAAPTAKLIEEPSAIAAALPPPAVRSAGPAEPALTLAPLQDSSSLGRRVRPAAPAVLIMRSSDSGPRITLPGPALPRALNSLEDAGIAKILVDRPKPEKSGSRGWITGMLVAAILLVTFVGLELYNAPRSSASASPAAVSKEAAPAAEVPAPAEASPAPASFSLSKAVEVTGFRFTGHEKPEVHYLVVNHSPGELGAVTVYVTLRASASKLPLYHFSFRSPTLGPYESKEMVSPVDKLPKGAADWQTLHADVEVGQ